MMSLRTLVVLALSLIAFSTDLLAEPKTLAETLAELQSSQQKLTEAISAKDAKPAHEIAEGLSTASLGIIDLLDEAQAKSLSAQIRSLSRNYEKIHFTVENGAFDDAAKENTLAKAVLAHLESQLTK